MNIYAFYLVQPLSKKVLGSYLGGVCMFSVCFLLTAYNLSKQGKFK